MSFVIPIRVKRRRGSPTGSALLFAILGLLIIGGGLAVLASGATCDGEEMREGDQCVYREEGKTEVDHTNSKADQERFNLYAGLGALGLGIGFLAYAPFIYRKVQRHNAQLARAPSRAPGAGPAPAAPPMQTAYASQVARHAADRRHPAPPPLPPAETAFPTTGPQPHHDA